MHFIDPISVKQPMAMKHVKVRIIHTAIDNTRNNIISKFIKHNYLTVRRID